MTHAEHPLERTLEPGNVRLTYNSNTSCTIAQFGATLTSWICGGKEFIFVSSKAKFDNKTAIRGGIPIVFPNFGPWSLGPQHGFARTSQWKVEQQPTKDSSENVTAKLSLEDNELTRGMWNHKFKLIYTVTLGEKFLETSFCAENTGEEEFEFTCLLHTYFRVPDVSKAAVSNLKGLQFIDKIQNGARCTEDRNEVTIGQTVDRVYEGTPDYHVISGVTGGKAARLEKRNFPDTVVWNPWEKGLNMADLGEEYINMLCVEAGHVTNAVKLAAGSSFTASQTLTVTDA